MTPEEMLQAMTWDQLGELEDKYMRRAKDGDDVREALERLYKEIDRRKIDDPYHGLSDEQVMKQALALHERRVKGENVEAAIEKIYLEVDKRKLRSQPLPQYPWYGRGCKVGCGRIDVSCHRCVKMINARIEFKHVADARVFMTDAAIFDHVRVEYFNATLQNRILFLTGVKRKTFERFLSIAMGADRAATGYFISPHDERSMRSNYS